jgi:hypothetical protein
MANRAVQADLTGATPTFRVQQTARENEPLIEP